MITNGLEESVTFVSTFQLFVLNTSAQSTRYCVPTGPHNLITAQVSTSAGTIEADTLKLLNTGARMGASISDIGLGTCTNSDFPVRADALVTAISYETLPLVSQTL